MWGRINGIRGTMRRLSWTFSGCSVPKLCVVFSQEIALRATEELQLTGGKLVRDVLQHKKVSPCEKGCFWRKSPYWPPFLHRQSIRFCGQLDSRRVYVLSVSMDRFLHFSSTSGKTRHALKTRLQYSSSTFYGFAKLVVWTVDFTQWSIPQVQHRCW